MNAEARLDYFYGTQCEQFQFLTVPLVFFDNPIYGNLDCDEIMLYSHMLRRINLSRRNGWIDELNRVYIRYSQKEARNDIRRGKDKVLDAYKTLEKYDLIERVDMGIGKADLIYVKNFASDKEYNGYRDINRSSFNEVNDAGTEKQYQGNTCDAEFPHSIVDNSASDTEFQMPWGRKIRLDGCGKTESKDNYLKNIYQEIDISSHSVDYMATRKNANDEGEDDLSDNTNVTERVTNESKVSTIDLQGRDNEPRNAYFELVKKNIGYDERMEILKPSEKDIFETMFRVICDTVCSDIPENEYISIGKERKPFNIVKSAFLKLRYEHLEFAMRRLETIRSPVTDMKRYLQAVLYNAYLTMDMQITQDLRVAGVI